MTEKSEWTSLEITKLVVGATTPALIAFFGYHLNTEAEARSEKLNAQAIARAESIAQFERVTQKRVELWDEVGPRLNDIYAYLMYVGHWKDMDSEHVVRKKREVDKLVYSYQPFFSQEFHRAYGDFMKASFLTFNGMREDAKPNTTVEYRDGQAAGLVSGQENPDGVYDAYYGLLEIVADDFQLKIERPSKRPIIPSEQNQAER